MITWMQRHKKYLVVTIWISVIAFVGAGFVGWGAYDFNSDRASAVAKVEDRKITVQEFQLAYSNFYNFYNQQLGGSLTQEKANEMGLEKIVMENVINEALLLGYADEIGLIVLDDEIKDTIANDPGFQVDGVFNKETYYRAIKGNQISPKDYENGLKKQILLNKLQKTLELTPTKKEVELFISSMLMQDRLAVDTIYLDSSEVSVSDDEAKKYWGEHRGDYLSEKSYDLETISIALSTTPIDPVKLKEFYQSKKHNYKDSEGKLETLEVAKARVERDFKLKESKREALETYLLFKKAQMNATGTLNVKESDTTFPVEKLVGVNRSQVLKPIETKNGYMVVKVKSVNSPAPKPFEDAKSAIVETLKVSKQTTALENKAQSRLDLFQGKDIGFVSRDSATRIAGLTDAESLELINFVFDNNKMRNYKVIGNKAVLYQILEQNLLRKDKARDYTDLVNNNVVQMKRAELNQNLIEMFRKRYDIEQYYKGN